MDRVSIPYTGCPVTDGGIVVLRENHQFWPNSILPKANIDWDKTPFNISNLFVFRPSLKVEL